MDNKLVQFKYEVAFSFLAQDEPLALELAGLLTERLSVFVYSKQQENLAGTDGEISFNRVFAQEARLVVVLYRQGWGESPWTRIEQTAIRNRAFESGYEFVLFIKLDKSDTPKWLPKTQLWLGLDRWGIEHAASTIETKVNQLGGTVRTENAVERARRLARERAAEEEKLVFLGSKRGVEAALAELGKLFDSFVSIAEQISAAMPRAPIRTYREENRLILNCAGMAMTIAWSQQWANTLQHSALYIMTWNGEVPPVSMNPPDKRSEERFHFDRLATGTVGWRSNSPTASFFLTDDLSDYYLKLFLEEIASQGEDEG
jgi:hypothetical protein